jgi:hypothetical protein
MSCVTAFSPVETWSSAAVHAAVPVPVPEELVPVPVPEEPVPVPEELVPVPVPEEPVPVPVPEELVPEPVPVTEGDSEPVSALEVPVPALDEESLVVVVPVVPTLVTWGVPVVEDGGVVPVDPVDPDGEVPPHAVTAAVRSRVVCAWSVLTCRWSASNADWSAPIAALMPVAPDAPVEAAPLVVGSVDVWLSAVVAVSLASAALS